LVNGEPKFAPIPDVCISECEWNLQDIVSYHLDRPRGNKHNLVAILISENGYSIQNAVMSAATLVKQSIDAFLATEMLLLPPPSSVCCVASSRTRRRSSKSPIPTWDPKTERDVRLYVRSLRDCIAGFINWMYETEMFFGGNGSEVRSFGWVFLAPVLDKPGEG
jgi:hypothetical protein